MAERERQSDSGGDAISHNLYGQRLGRKGRDTRDRIIAAAQGLLSAPEVQPVTLSAVAREASLGMTTLYLYFSDLTELLIAVLEPVMGTAEDAYLGLLRTHWSDEELAGHCYAFMCAYHQFWQSNTRILHMRNALADQHDNRMIDHRIAAGTELIGLIVQQMERDPADTQSAAYDMATFLIAGMERVVTLTTIPDRQNVVLSSGPRLDQRMHAVARLLELGIRENRSAKSG